MCNGDLSDFSSCNIFFSTFLNSNYNFFAQARFESVKPQKNWIPIYKFSIKILYIFFSIEWLLSQTTEFKAFSIRSHSPPKTIIFPQARKPRFFHNILLLYNNFLKMYLLCVYANDKLFKTPCCFVPSMKKAQLLKCELE